MEASLEFTFWECILVGVLYFWAWLDMSNFPFYSLFWQDPVIIGLAVGILYGDVATGLILGGSIGMIYFYNSSVGANLPSDSTLAACITIPIAIKYGLGIEAAIPIAVPFAILGALLDNLRRLINGVWNRRARVHIANGEYHKLKIDGIWGPLAVGFALRAVPLTLLLYFAGDAVGQALSVLPQWLVDGFSVVAGLLPAVGLIMCVRLIGRKEILPYFLIAYLITQLTGWGTLTLAVIFTLIAFLHVSIVSKSNDEEEEAMVEEQAPRKGMFTMKDIFVYYLRYTLFFRTSQSIEYFYGTGIMYSMYPFLKKIYKDDEEALKDALTRHLAPFITNPGYGAWLLTSSIALEEENAAGTIKTEDIPETITSMKTSMMGPFAGLGDSICGNYFVLYKTIFYPFALQGSIIGMLGPLAICVWMSFESWIFISLGYKAGLGAIRKFVSGNRMKEILMGAAILGTSMMGALAAGYVSLETTISWMAGEIPMTLQGTFDKILPGLLPLLYMGGVYIAMKKNVKYIYIILGTVALGLIGSLINIF